MKKCLNASTSVVAAVILSCAVVGGGFDAAAIAQEGKDKAKAKDSKPAVFSNVSFEEARKSTEGSEKILIVKGTAEWCGPCKQMDKTTWKDEAVVKWVKDNGLAIAVDVDKEEKVAQKLSIQAMPTMIAFRNGKEAGRVVGYTSAADLVKWANTAKAGKFKRSSGIGKRGAYPMGEAGDEDSEIDRCISLAWAYMDRKEYDDASEEYVWLWQNMLAEEPSSIVARTGYMAEYMKELATLHSPALTAFAKLRDDTEVMLKGENRSFQDLVDWIVLNNVVQEAPKTLEWFDRIKSRPSAVETFAKVDYLVEPVLKEASRFADLGLVIRDPLIRVRRAHFTHQVVVGSAPIVSKNASEEYRANMRVERDKQVTKIFLSECATVYKAMLASKREDDAVSTANEAIQLLDTTETRMGLVRAALEVGEARAEHKAMLDDALKATIGESSLQLTSAIESLASQVEQALQKR